MMTRVALGIAAGGVVLALVAWGAWLLFGGTQVSATGNAQEWGIDPDPTGNTASFVGTVDDCIHVANGATFQVDVYVKGIPADDGVRGYEYDLNFTDSLVGVVTGLDRNFMLRQTDGTNCPDYNFSQDGVPDWTSPWWQYDADLGDPATCSEPEDGDGVLARLTLQAHATNNGLATLEISPDYRYVYTIDYPSTIAFNNYKTAQIAVGTATCPAPAEPADLEKQAFQPGNFDLNGDTTYETVYAPGLDIPVSEQIWFQVSEQVINNGDADSVDAKVTVTCEPPESIITPGTPGGQCSYHVAATTETVDVDGATLDCTAPGTLPILCSNTCTDGACPVDTIIRVQWPHILSVHKLPPPLLEDVFQVLTQVWDVHCLEPSSHVWHFGNDIEAVDPVAHPDPVSNNHLDFYLNLDCMAEADLEVTNAAVAAPPSAVLDEPFDVTVSATATNLGTWSSVNADVTFDLDLTGTDCTKAPNTPLTIPGLILGAFSPWATWGVTCGTLTSETFGGSATIALSSGQPHISDPVVGNNGPISATTDSINIVAASADVEVISWSMVDEDDLPNIGLQVLIEPGTPATIHTEQVIDNDGPDGPAPTDDDRTVADVASVCDVEPNLYGDSFNLAVDDPVQQDDSWTVSWIDVSKPPYWCDLTFNKLLTITDPGFADPDPDNNDGSVTVRMVLDSDGDGVPDDGDLSGSDTDEPCAPGESTFCDDNCEDDDNAGQEDMDDDGIGDVCDPDNDNDLIPDDWDGDTILDDPCTGGDTTDCDDNCRLIANPLQGDAESDGIGNVCELDVNCSGGGPNGADALMVLQRILGRVGLDPVQCPAPNGDLYAPRASAYVAYDPAHPELVGTGRDALMILQCLLSRNNIVCPLVAD